MSHLRLGDHGLAAGRIHRMQIRNVLLKAQLSHKTRASPSHIGSHPSDADSERSRPTYRNHELRPEGIHSSGADSERSQQPSNVLDNGAISSTVTFESDRSGLSTVVRGGTVLTTAAALRLDKSWTS